MPGGASWKMVLKKAIQKQVKNNLVLYFLVLVFFAAGIAAGAFTVDALSSVQKEELINYFQSFYCFWTRNRCSRRSYSNSPLSIIRSL